MKDNMMANVTQLKQALGADHFNTIMTRIYYYETMHNYMDKKDMKTAEKWDDKLFEHSRTKIYVPEFIEKVDHDLWQVAQKYKVYVMKKSYSIRDKDKIEAEQKKKKEAMNMMLKPVRPVDDDD